MDERQIQTKYFIGNSTAKEWSSVYHYLPQSQDFLEKKGEIFAIFNLKAPEGFEASTAGNLLTDHFHEAYFESKKTLISEALNVAISAVSDRLSELLVNEEEIIEKGVDLNVVAMVIKGEEVYFANLGSNKILLLAGDSSQKLIDVTAALRDPFGKGVIKIGSSYLKTGQRFILLTEKLQTETKSEDLLVSAKSFNDLRFKNADYENPEAIALMMIGVNLPKIVEEEKVQPDLKTVLSEESNWEDEQPKNSEITTDQPTEESPNTLADFGFANEGITEAEHSLDEYEPLMNDEREEQEEALVEEQISTELPEKPNRVSDRIKQLLAKVKARRALKQKQSMRQSGQFERESLNKEKTTIQVYWQKFKDVLLYDVLKINQRQWFGISRDRNNNFVLILLGIRLNKNSIMLIGAVVVIVLAYFSIKNLGEQRDRENKIQAALVKYDMLKTDIKSMSTSPILNPKSVNDTAQREKLLTDEAALEARFTADLNILPATDLEQQKALLADIKQKIIRAKTPTPKILIDVANLFEGSITDIAKVGDNLYILDGQKGKIYRQPIAGGTAELITDKLTNPTSIAADSDGQLIVYDQGSGGSIVSVNPASKDITKSPAVTAQKLPVVTNMETYSTTNNLYVIPFGSNQILQLNRAGKVYGAPQSKPRFTETDGHEIKDLQIFDGIIYALVDGKGIERVGQSNARVEAFSGIIDSLNTGAALSLDQNYIYVADNVNNRLLVFNRTRDGQPIADFVAQLMLPQLDGPILEISSDSTKNIILVATATRVYTLSRADVLS